jgi:hypothetical protein
VIRSAQEKHRIDFASHQGVLMAEIQAEGPVPYRFILVVSEKQAGEPCLLVTSEVNQFDAQRGGGSHFLCTFDEQGHANLGGSDDWAREDLFLARAKEVVSQRLGVRQVPQQPAPRIAPTRTQGLSSTVPERPSPSRQEQRASLVLRVIAGPDDRKEIIITGGTILGRASGGDDHITLRDFSVSRKHARIDLDEGEQWMISDLESTCGVHVNGAQVQTTALAAGDRIKLGVFEFEVVSCE